jgi:hypothetical protein
MSVQTKGKSDNSLAKFASAALRGLFVSQAFLALASVRRCRRLSLQHNWQGELHSDSVGTSQFPLAFMKRVSLPVDFGIQTILHTFGEG